MKKEEQVLKQLTKAFNLFCKMKRQHPDELRDFVDGIHKCQYIIGMRYARKQNFKIFPNKIRFDK